MTLMLCHSSFVIYRVTRYAIVQIMPRVSYSDGRKERTPSQCNIIVLLHTERKKKENNAIMLIMHGKKRVSKILYQIQEFSCPSCVEKLSKA